MTKFKFERLSIWRDSISLANELLVISDEAFKEKYFGLSDQFRRALISISNIAEGSGSYSDKDFANFLNIAKRSVYECASMLYIFEMRKLISKIDLEIYLDKLDKLSAQITNFRKTILRKIK